MKRSSSKLLTLLSRVGLSVTVLALLALLAQTSQAAPIIANVVETGGDNEATDTITAKWTGQTFNCTVDNEPVPGITIGTPYTVGVFGNHAPAYVDRNHRYTNAEPPLIPPYLLGLEYIMSGNDNRDNGGYLLDVTVNSAVQVYLLIDNRLGDPNSSNADPPSFGPTKMQWVLDEGWVPVTTGVNRAANPALPDEVGIDEGADGTLNQWFSVYTKRFGAGTFQLKQADNAGQNMYGVVVASAQLTNVFAPGDAIILVNGVNDGDGNAGPPPGAETVDHAIDRFTQKYLNFLDLGSGFATTPSVGGTVVQSIRFYTANDAEPRDPASYLLEGSTSGLAGPWTAIASGPLALPAGRNPGGMIPIDPTTQFNQLVEFSNTALYTSYRVTFPTLKDAGNANSMQIAEVELLGVVVVRAPSITMQPADQTVRQGLEATFTVSADGTPPLAYQWFRKLAGEASFSAIDGATSPSHTTPGTLYPEDDNSLFKVEISNSVGTTASREAILQVMQDTNPPTLVSALGSSDFMHVTIQFSEEVDLSTGTDTFNYGLDGGLAVLGAVRSPDRRSVTLETTMQAENTIYNVTVNSVKDLAGNPIADNSQVSFRSFVVSCGGLLFEAYSGIGGNNVADLTGHPNFPSNPTERRVMPVFDTRTVYPDNSHEGYGGRIRGLFIPPTSGNWLFYLGSDDASQLFLNPNGPSAAGKTMIVAEPGCCATWTAHVSAPIPLTAGQGYYIECLYKEGTGGDYAKVAARLQGAPVPEDNPNGQIEVSSNAIPSSMLGYPAAPLDIGGGVVISQQPQDQTVLQCRTATFCVSASNPNDLPICYQWRSNGLDIAGANGPCHTTPLLGLADDGTVYDCALSVIGTRAASAPATLHVGMDTAPPVCVEARGTASQTNAVLTFDEILDSMSAMDTFNYSVDPPLTVLSASLDASGRIVTLSFLETLSQGATYCVTATGVKDCSGANSTPGTRCCFRAFVMSRGCVNQVKQELYMGITGVNVLDLTTHASYPNSPTETRFKPSVEANTADEFDNYGSRLSGYLVPPVTGNYHFAMSSDDGGDFLLSTDSDPANRRSICFEPVWNGRRDWLGTARRGAGLQNRSTTRFPAGIPLVAGQFYYFESLMKEGTGGDNQAVTWQIPGGPAISAASLPIPGAYVVNIFEGLADPAGATITVTQHPQDTAVVANTLFTLSAAATGMNVNGPTCVLLTWQKDDGTGTFVDVPGIVGSPGTFVAAAQAPNCDGVTRYRAKFESLGAEAAYSQPANVQIVADTASPQIVSAVRGAIALDRVTATFNETLDAASANNPANYSIDNGVMVTGAALGPDGRTVVLSTAAALANGTCYTLTAGAVLDPCGNPANPQAKIFLVGAHVPAPGDPNNMIVIEAEDVDGRAPARGHDWNFETLGGGGGFSGPGYIYNIPNGAGAVGDTDLNAERVDYAVNLPVAGTWYAWARGRSPGALGNSAHIGIDGVRPTTGRRFGNAGQWNGDNWQWDFVLDGAVANAARFDVASAGLHTFHIWAREDGLQIDKIILLPVTGNPPGTTVTRSATVLGPAATPREITLPPPTVVITSPANGSMLECGEPVTICADAPSCDPMLRVDFLVNGQTLGSATAPPFCITVPGPLVQTGDYTLTAKATDSAGQMATSTPVIVMVRDTIPPALSCPSDIMVPNDPGRCSAVVSYEVPTAIDACDGAIRASCDPAPGSEFRLGTTQVSCTAADRAGNRSTCTFNVVVEDTEAPRIATIGLCTETHTNTFISPNGSDVCFILEATGSPGGNPPTYAWFLDGSLLPFATGPRTTNCFDVGQHTIRLVCDNGQCVRTASVTVNVLTGCEAVEDLIAKVNDASLARANKRPLIATLKAACASFERGSFESAVGQLGAFINKVRAQIQPANPDEAALFTRCAQSILESMACEEAGGP